LKTKEKSPLTIPQSDASPSPEEVADSKLLEHICMVAGIGGWDLDLSTATLRWTAQTRLLHEVPPDYLPTLHGVTGFYPPGERELMDRVFHDAITYGEPFDLEVPLITAKGRQLYVRVIAHIDHAGGEPIRILGSYHDVTERRMTAEALRASEKVAQGQAEALAQAMESVAGESETDRIAEHVLRTVIDRLKAHSSTLWLRSGMDGMMEFEFGVENGKFLTKFDDTPYGNGLPLRFGRFYQRPRTLRTEKPYMLEDIREGIDFPWRQHLLDQGVFVTLKIPMQVSGNVEGVMGIRFTQQRDFLPGEIDFAQSMANQAMLSLKFSQLRAQGLHAAVIEERNRMAREIHDTLAQGFTGVIVQLEAGEEAIAQSRLAKAAEHLSRARELARESLGEARRSVRALRPMALDKKSLGEALKDVIRKMTKGTKMCAKFSVQGEQRELPSEWETSLLRIGVEVLTNALRHSMATEFHGLLVFDTGEIRMNLRDNGIGFDSAAKSRGFGLRGMIERAESIGARLSMESARDKGTMISVVIPLGSQPEERKR
jgi:signal transduction histidine kinase